MRKLKVPFNDKDIADLKAGEQILLSGVIYTARDAAHKRMVEGMARGEPLPIGIKGQVVYYVGPTPAKPGQVIGSAGPTTSSRMDAYTPRLLEAGLKGMIGKGKRSPEVVDAIKKYKAVYFAAAGGAGALLSRRIKTAEVVAYDDLGPEAIYRIEVEDFPVIVVNDIYGNDLYEEAQMAF
ncbi:MAG: Fe-S-containing hydro-lyase [Deltaproteobacteria bacterium]